MNEKNKKPQIRFAGFTDDWEQRKLGEIADIRRGASPRPIQNPIWFDKDSDIGWLRIADVTEQNGKIYRLEQKLSEQGQKHTLVLTEPHLILSIAATVGKPVINYIPTGIHDGFIVFLNLDADMEFLYQWLGYFQENWKNLGQSGSQVNINSDLVRNLEISLPSKAEQTAIGNFFKQLDETIALHQRECEKYQNLKISYLEKMFPKENEQFPELRFPEFTDAWEQRKLGEVLKIKSGMSQKDVEVENGIYPILATGGEIGRTNTALYSKESVLIGRKGTIDKPYYMNTPFWTVDTLFYSELSSYVTGQFIYTLFQKIKWRDFDTSTGVPSLTSATIHSIEVKIPSKAEQTAIGNFFKQLDETIALHQRKAEKYKQIKQAYLEKMFV